MTSAGKKEKRFGTAGFFAPDEKIAESQDRRGSTILPDGRRMSRIGPPVLTDAIVLDVDSQDEHGRLVEMEAENAIKYRTCSWQKVIKSSFHAMLLVHLSWNVI
jgi:hypothetical protein